MLVPPPRCPEVRETSAPKDTVMLFFLDERVRRFLLLILVPFVLAACQLVPTNGPNASVSGNIAIIAPPDGSQLEVGAWVDVQSQIQEPGGARAVALSVNEVLLRRDAFSTPMYDGVLKQPWRPMEPGVYTLQAMMETSQGEIVSSQPVTVTVAGDGAVVTTPPSVVPTTAVPTTVVPTTFVPTTAVPTTVVPTTFVPTVVTITVTPSLTPSKTVTPTFTPILLTAPEPLSPSGTLACADTTTGITLSWEAVSHPHGIDHYEWELEGGEGAQSGTTSATQAEIASISCGYSYQWRVRVVGSNGRVGPYSDDLSFTID